ncbi:MAG: 2-oxo acid dehydrogenase subunit E2 [Deltaproteobacteria bacterium]|nr:2-oxo acid dehydrogenase subunit E2 [Deltaproteobacteria bacterium]
MTFVPTQRQRFTPARHLSSWRRLSLHVWRKPADPTVYGLLDVNMRRALAYLEAINREPGHTRVTVTHLVVKGIAKALAETPEANGIIAMGRIYLRDSVDVYCQVATDGGKDLSGVKVTGVDRKSVVAVADELVAAVAAVREGRDRGSEATKKTLARVPDRLLGLLVKASGLLSYDLRLDLSAFGIAFDQFGGAMVSNIGSFGVGTALAPLVPVSRTPIVLLVGEVTDRPAVEDGALVIAPILNIGASFDHRMIDGYQASKMARTVVASISDPEAAFGPPTRSS